MDCRTAWFGVSTSPRYSRSYQRYTVHERALYFKSNLLVFPLSFSLSLSLFLWRMHAF